MALTRLPKSLRNWTVYIDGYGYAGVVKEGTVPKIALKTFEYSGGGMIGTVDIQSGAVEKIEFDITLGEVNPAVLGLIGVENTPISFRGAQGSEYEAVIIDTRSLLKEGDPGGWKTGEEATLKLSATASYYKLSVAGSSVIEIDVVNMVWKRLGVDLLATLRSALGM